MFIKDLINNFETLNKTHKFILSAGINLKHLGVSGYVHDPEILSVSNDIDEFGNVYVEFLFKNTPENKQAFEELEGYTHAMMPIDDEFYSRIVKEKR